MQTAEVVTNPHGLALAALESAAMIAAQPEPQPQAEPDDAETETVKAIGSATYSPEDNKLRISAFRRLDAETYKRVRAAGYIWAPRQDIFVAPMWTPEREDLALKLCGGEIEDEDTSLVDRAEQRAERFDGYKDNRIADATQAQRTVDAIAEHIPMGQPILIGHHSERHARKDAERIRNGMSTAVKMWDTARYWEQRAAGAIRHAKYKELPAVRYRRIKGLEADKRKRERERDEALTQLATWQKIAAIEDADKQKEIAVAVAGRSRVWVSMPRKDGDREDFNQTPSVYDALTHSYPTLYAPRTVSEVLTRVIDVLTRSTAPGNHTARWIQHYENRIAYERAMLQESGNIAAAGFDFQPGGKVLRRGIWLIVLKVNKRDGVAQSLTVSGHFATTCGVDEVTDYKAPTPEETAAVTGAMKLPPLCNYPGEGFAQMTQAEYTGVYSDHKRGEVIKETETHGKHRRRSVDNFIARKHGAPGGSQWGSTPVFLTDAKRIDPPMKKPTPPDAPTPGETLAGMAADLKASTPPARAYTPAPRDTRIPDSNTLDRMKQVAKDGVQVVNVPQLFPTPPEIARQMIAAAGIRTGHAVLEPSAGTGNLLAALSASDAGTPGEVLAVELNPTLAQRLGTLYPAAVIVPGDFLAQNGNLGTFDRIVMNPPFANGADIVHINHARAFLKPGGRIVALCADGPRQAEKLRPLASTWQPLPPGSFSTQGTGVDVVMLTIDN